MEEQKKKINWIQLLGLTIIVLLAVEDVMLILQNRQLKLTLRNITTPIEPLSAGDKAEPFQVQDINGSVTELSYAGKESRYLLFVLSPTCPHCERNLPQWQSIFEKNWKSDCMVLGVCIGSLAKTQTYVRQENITFRVTSVAIDTSFVRKYKISGVPVTILVNAQGIVEKIWNGELGQDQVREIEDLLDAAKALSSTKSSNN